MSDTVDEIFPFESVNVITTVTVPLLRLWLLLKTATHPAAFPDPLEKLFTFAVVL